MLNHVRVFNPESEPVLNESEITFASSDPAVMHRAEKIVQSRQLLLSIAERLMSDALRTHLTASDVVQQTLLAAIRDQASFRGSSEQELTQWLVKILKHRIIDEARKQDARSKYLSPELVAVLPVKTSVSQPNPLSDLVAQETLEQLLNAINHLNTRQQAVVRLRYVESLSFDKIGEMLSLSHDSVRRLWLKAMQSLGQSLGAESNR